MKKRYLSLDVFRGLTVALMIVVNNPGSWSVMFPPLSHAEWNGCTPTDLVFPFFLFCVGTSMAFALSKFDGLSKEALGKIFRRGAGIFLVGLALNAYPFFPTRPDPEMSFWQNWLEWLHNLRIFGVLQRISLCYILASVLVLWLRTTKKLLVSVGILSALHVAVLLLFAGPEGAFTLEGCFAKHVDIAVLGASHVYDGFTYADGTAAIFDPEGLLGVLTGACTAILGYLTGKLLRGNDEMNSKIVRLYSMAAVSLAFSQILSIWIPINKALWSVSYVFYTAGWAMLILAFITWLVEVNGWNRCFTPLKALGMNPLALFALSGLLAKTVGGILRWDVAAVFGANEFMSLLHALIFLVVLSSLAMVLYKKNVIIKI